MEQEFIIASESHYHETMAAIYELMNRGEESLTEVESKRLGLMTQAAEKYEDDKMELRPEGK